MTLEGGRITDVRADKDDVFSRGHICPKGPAMREVLEFDLLIAVVNQRIGAGGNADNNRVLLRPKRELRKGKVDADSWMEEKGRADQEQQQQQETKIRQRNEEDQKRIQMD